MTDVTCAECGQQTTVPFVPRNGNPVFCSMCYDKVKQRTQADERELAASQSA
jgi:CxxC-x17-CxxC domain-containing protein